MESLIHLEDLVGRSRLLKRFCERLRARPLLVLPLFVALYGAATVDRLDFVVLSTSPFTLHPDVRHQFLHSSPLMYFIGYPLTRTLGDTWSYFIVTMGGIAAAIFALDGFVTHRYGARSNEALLMVLATPLLIVLTQYIGKCDPFVVASFFLLAASPNPLLQTFAAGMVVLSHMEMGLLLLASAMWLRAVPRLTTAIGAVLGTMLVLGYLFVLLPAVPHSRAGQGLELLHEAIEAVAAAPVQHLLLSCGPFWICVLMAGVPSPRWMLALLATSALATVTLDFTRVFILVALPLVIVTIDGLLSRADAPAPAKAAPPWFNLLPLFPFFQAHLLSQSIFDSRIPALVMRLLGHE